MELFAIQLQNGWTGLQIDGDDTRGLLQDKTVKIDRLKKRDDSWMGNPVEKYDKRFLAKYKDGMPEALSGYKRQVNFTNMEKSPGREKPIVSLTNNEFLQLKKELTDPSEERIYNKKYDGERFLAHYRNPHKAGKMSNIDRWDHERPSMAGESNFQKVRLINNSIDFDKSIQAIDKLKPR